MSVRKAIFWLHLICGVLAGVVILVMSVTGVILAYERQITAMADGVRVTPPTADTARLPLDALLAKVRNAESNAIPSAIALRSDRQAPVAFSFGREKTIFANPYTGELLGNGAASTRAFFAKITGFHRWLGAEGEGREVGKAITGASNLVFLFLVLSGIILWWPKKWTISSLRAITLFKKGLQGKARDWNWHNVIGFWAAIPLFFIVSTAVVISYPWSSNLVYTLTGSTPPPTNNSGGGKQTEMTKSGGPASSRSKTERTAKPVAEMNWTHFEKMWSQAEKQVEGWKIISLRMPTSAEAPFPFTIDRGNGARPDLRATLTFAPGSGEVVSYEPYSSQNLGRRVRLWIRWIHTGEAGGFIGQLIAGLASLGAIFLVWTGFMLTWRRFTGRKNKFIESGAAQSSADAGVLHS